MNYLPLLGCRNCGHPWVPRGVVAKKCPKCKSKRITTLKKNYRPYTIYNNKKYTLRPNGYYATTERDPGRYRYLHQDKVRSRGEPYIVHHIDEKKKNNRKTNLAIMKRAKHSELFSSGKNQYS